MFKKREIESQKTQTIHDNKKIPIYYWVISWIIAGFYILSSVGWFCASLAFFRGQLPGADEFMGKLSIFDHTIRYLQVIIIFVGSIILCFMRKLSYRLFLISLFGTLIGMFIKREWTISFLSPIVLVPSFLYIFYLQRKKILK